MDMSAPHAEIADSSKHSTFLVISDLHIHDWHEHSTLDPYGRPSRLIDYLALAHLVADQVESSGAHAILVAGDVLQSPLSRPSVLEVARRFFSIISEAGVPILVIPGQHDLDTKEASTIEHNCVLNILEGIWNVHVFYSDTTVYLCDGTVFDAPPNTCAGCVSIHCRPWQRSTKIELNEDVDVLLTHGKVAGSTNPQGHKFMNGLALADLTRHASIAVVGDIHNGTSLPCGDRVVLVPGNATQNTYSDSPVCGMWTFEIAPGEPARTLTFLGLHDLAPGEFHRFVYDESTGTQERVHRRQKTRKAGDKQIDVSQIGSLDSLKACVEEIIRGAKIEGKDEILELAQGFLADLSPTRTDTIRSLRVTSLYARAFSSIEEFSLNLDKIDAKSVVILGENGSGKTSIVEAIFWAITGKVTKSLSVNDVKNIYLPEIDPYVRLDLFEDDTNTTYSVRRKREAGSPSLEIHVTSHDTEKTTVIRKDTTGETQKELYRILGLEEPEIREAMYFSARKPTLYGELGATDRARLLSRVVNLEEVEALLLMVKRDLDTAKTQAAMAGTALDVHRTNLARARASLEIEARAFIEAKRQTSTPDVQSEIDACQGRLRVLYQEATGAPGHRELFEKTRDKLQALQAAEAATLGQLRTINDALQQECSHYTTVTNENRCYACGAQLPGDTDLKTAIKRRAEAAGAERARLSKKLAATRDLISTTQLHYSEAKLQVESDHEAQREIRELQDKMIRLQKSLPKSASTAVLADRIATLKTEIQTLEAQVTASEADLRQTNGRIEKLSFLSRKVFAKDGLLNEVLLARVVEFLEHEVNSILSGLPFRVRLDKTGTPEIEINGSTRSYGMISDGFKRAVDVLHMIAIHNLLAKGSNLEHGVLGLIAFDEILSFLDEKLADACVDAILTNTVADKCLLITHDARIASRFDTKILVTYDGRLSRYELQS